MQPVPSADDRERSYPDEAPIFLTGATGYVGGRLAPRLLDAGYAVRCLVRQPRKLDDRSWVQDPLVEVVEGDLEHEESLTEALRGCGVAYYLVHSMVAKDASFTEADRKLALGFARAAKAAGVQRIVYLGGLGELGPDLSEHLMSRREVETVLGSTGVPVTTLRAAMIIGSGSASFEILRYLVERLPIMVTPRWVRTECQPVGIHDVLHWLMACLEEPKTAGATLEIGGPDVLPYRELMQVMAEELGLRRRWIMSLPVLTPGLSSLWIGFVTPVSGSIGRPLAEGLRNRVVVGDHDVQKVLPHPALGVREAIQRALDKMEAGEVDTRWSAAGVVPGDPDWAGGTLFEDERRRIYEVPPLAVWTAVCRVGGGHGWYAADWLWKLRGWMDQLVGGPGLRRGRRHPERVEYGEALDFWRVIGLERGRYLGLLAEMKVPGEAMLSFRMKPLEGGTKTELIMSARFQPKGLLGLGYWYSVLPFHHIVFRGMLDGIGRAATAIRDETTAPPDLTHAQREEAEQATITAD